MSPRADPLLGARVDGLGKLVRSYYQSRETMWQALLGDWVCLEAPAEKLFKKRMNVIFQVVVSCDPGFDTKRVGRVCSWCIVVCVLR